MPRLLRLALIGAAGMSLLLALTASARVGVAASAGPVRAESAAVPFPLSVRDAFLRKLGGRIAGTATIVNTGNASVRSTTGVLGLTRGAVANATGVVTFSVPSLPPRGSRKVRFTSGRLHALPLRSGNYKVLICTDIYSQIQRFAWNTNCSLGGEILLSATGLPNASRPVPNTVIGARVANVSRSSTQVVAFASTVTHSAFQCRLDGAPWLACSSPRRYAALSDGRHRFDVRAVSPAGSVDPTPAHAT